MIVDRSKYKEIPIEISGCMVNLIAIPFFISLILLSELLYWIVWNEGLFGGEKLFTGWGLLGLIVGIVIHEIIHGIVAAKHCDNGWKSIKFGVIWKYGAAYCHCAELLTVKKYRQVLVAPSVVAAVMIPVSVAIQSHTLLVVSTLLLAGGIGDFTILFKLRKETVDVLVWDYPDKIGGAVFVPMTDQEIQEQQENYDNEKTPDQLP